MVIVKRRYEIEKVKSAMPWVCICGRRKTGKTFFVKNFLKFDEYFFVRRDGAVFDKESKEISYQTFFELFKEILEKKTVVIDEFHRLPDKFFEFLHSQGIKGNLIVVSSTLWLSKKLLGKGSPLLGLFSLVVFGLIDERDILYSLKVKEKRELIEAATYLREPILLPRYNPPLKKFLSAFLTQNKLLIREIIGEIFEEEEKRLSDIYEAIMRAISAGKSISTEISSYLFSRNLIPKDNPGYVQRYLDNLVKIGILEKFQIWNKNKFRYFHISPLFDLHFYLDEKYGYTENDIPEKFVESVIREKLPLHVEQFFRNLLSKIFGMKKIMIEEPQIDIALCEFKKLRVVAEVKWKEKVSKTEIKSIEEKLNKFKNCRKILIVPENKVLEREPEGIEVWDVKRVLREIKERDVP
jgi:hypothetical protein